jgi:hypothetical protein
MGRGLSDLQKKILDILNDRGEINRRELSPLIYGEHPTRTEIVDLSKSLNRLHNRGLIDLYIDCGAGHNSEGFYHLFARKMCQIEISPRGAAYLRGEELPPLVTTLKQYPGKCWCGAKLPAPGKDEQVLQHKLLPSHWRIEFIG